MVRLVPCGVRACRQAVIDRERERETKRPSQTRKGRKNIVEQNTYYAWRLVSSGIFRTSTCKVIYI
jgi:hypothetical protein